jgi:hypothetical protein
MQVGGLLPGVDLTEIAKKAAMNAVMANPLVKQATEVVGPVRNLVDPASPKSLGHLQETLKTAIAETVDTKIASGLAAAGISPGAVDPSAVANAAAEAANGEGNNAESNNEGNNAESNNESNNAESNNEGNNGESNNGEGNAEENAEENAGENQEGGSRRYEIVTLSSPIDEPLFVCYKSGKPVYFTNSSRGFNILPMHSKMEARFKKSTKKRKVTKKASKKKLSRKRR